jgi:hypothetical protein
LTHEPHRKQGKDFTGHIKVLNRAIPFEHLGREKDARVFIARTLEPGEAAPCAVVVPASKHQKQKQKAAAIQMTATSLSEVGRQV